jgi:hypothetical protein
MCTKELYLVKNQLLQTTEDEINDIDYKLYCHAQSVFFGDKLRKNPAALLAAKALVEALDVEG